MAQDSFLVRKGDATEIAEVARIHRMAREQCMPYLPVLHTPQEDHAFFRDRVFPTCAVWVADVGWVVGFCAFRVDWVDHLYVDPAYHGRGIGSALLRKAMAAYSPIQLWVYQRNAAARAFYEGKGFKLVRMTNGESTEEKEPDALYRWSR